MVTSLISDQGRKTFHIGLFGADKPVAVDLQKRFAKNNFLLRMSSKLYTMKQLRTTLKNNFEKQLSHSAQETRLKQNMFDVAVDLNLTGTPARATFYIPFRNRIFYDRTPLDYANV